MQKNHSFSLLKVTMLLALLTANLGWGQVTIASQDFEESPANPTMSFGTTDIGTPSVATFSTGTSTGAATNVRPASSDLFASGSRGYRITGFGTSTLAGQTLTFSAINTIGYTNVQVSYRIAGMSIGSATNGMDNNANVDQVLLEVSPDGGTTWYDQSLLNLTGSGGNNAVWAFSATGTGTRAYVANDTFTTHSITNTASAPTLTGTSAITTVTVTNLPAISNLRVRISAQCNAANESWIIDDVIITGTLVPVTPTITVTPTSLNRFTYTVGAGPSSEQSFTVSGSNLTANLVLTPPANYEISKTSGSGFVSNPATLSFTPAEVASAVPVYVRLKSGLIVNPYNGQNIVATSGSTSQNITCNGDVFIAIEGFNNTTTLFATPLGGAYFTGNSVAEDRPATTTFVSEGSHAIGISNGTATLETNDISTIGYTDVSLSLKLASFSIGSTSNGADAGDTVTVEVSPDGGATWFSTLVVTGNGNAYWPYSAISVAETSFDGNTTASFFAPPAGGNNTTTGFGTLRINNLPSTGALRVRITMLNNATAERWLLDDFTVTGTLTSSPTRNVTAALNTFTYRNTAGPSSGQSFTVSGSSLDSGIVITPPASYEISTTANFLTTPNTITLSPTSNNLATTTIYVRLKSGLSIDTYNNQNIIISGGGVVLDTNVNCNGEVIDAIAFEGFNNSSSLFTITAGNPAPTPGAYFNGTTGSAAGPANASYAVEGSHAFGLASNGAGSTVLTSNDINTLGHTNIALSIRLAALSTTTSGGVETADTATLEISPDAGVTWFSTARVLGATNDFWSYTASGVGTTSYDGDATPLDFSRPAVTNTETLDGYSTLKITNLPSTATLKVRITLANDSTSEIWVVDDFRVTGENDTTTWTGATNTSWTEAGNWNPSLPSAISTVIIPNVTNKPVINTNESVRVMTIDAGARLTVNEGKTLNSVVSCTNNGDLILKSSATGTANLLSTSAVANVTQQYYLNSNQRGWRLISNPLSTINFSTLASNSTTPIALGNNASGTYISATNTWTDGTNADNMASKQAYKIFLRGRASEVTTNVYSVSPPSNVTLAIKGTATNSSPSTINTVAGQYYLVANPYTAPVSVFNILQSSTGLSNTTSYYNPTIGSSGNNADLIIKYGGYQTTTIAAATAGDTNDMVLPPMGAIFVQATTNGTINIPKTAIFTGPVLGGSYNFKTVQTTNAPSKLNLRVSSNNTFYDAFELYFNEVGQPNRNYDFGKLPNTVLDFYGIKANKNMAVAEMVLEPQVIPLTVNSTIQKSYAITVTENTIPVGFTAKLVDNFLNTTTVLSAGTTYNFTINSNPASQGNSRFAINLATATLSIGDKDLDDKVLLWPNPSHNEFNIKTQSVSNNEENLIQIYDSNGKIIYSTKVKSNNTTNIQTTDWASGFYLIKIITNGVETIKKLLIQ